MKYTLSLADVPTNTATCGLVNLALDRRDLRSAALPALLRAVIFPHLFGVGLGTLAASPISIFSR